MSTQEDEEGREGREVEPEDDGKEWDETEKIMQGNVLWNGVKCIRCEWSVEQSEGRNCFKQSLNRVW